MEGMGRQVFGCDICQDVCPWNRKRADLGADLGAAGTGGAGESGARMACRDGRAEFERTFNGSPVRRAGFLGLRRNVAIAMGNSGLAEFVPRLRVWADAADEGLRSAARWALEKLIK